MYPSYIINDATKQTSAGDALPANFVIAIESIRFRKTTVDYQISTCKANGEPALASNESSIDMFNLSLPYDPAADSKSWQTVTTNKFDVQVMEALYPGKWTKQ